MAVVLANSFICSGCVISSTKYMQESGFQNRKSNITRSGRSSVICMAAEGCDTQKEQFRLSRREAFVSVVAAAAFVAPSLTPARAEAGILSGAPGLESIKLPSLPPPDFLQKIGDNERQRYADLDKNFKDSPILQQLLKKSEENREMHKKEIEDKYCARGAEWGVGDCSLEGLPLQDRQEVLDRIQKSGKK